MPQKLRCRVNEIQEHSEQVYSLFLKPESPAPRFLPGQFLHLALDAYSPGDFWPDSRSFSIASAPAERQLLRITYSVKGQFTSRMEAELHEGSQVWIKMPYGDFLINAEKDVCLLAGGTGVTAFTAFLAGLPAEHTHHITLFYGARHPDLLIYRPLVESAAANCPNLHPYFLSEEGEAPGCISGRINLDQIWQALPDPQAVVYYLSGPPLMLKVVSSNLNERGVLANAIRIDAWE
jgi:ferredoxin-NADP reductase